MAKNLVLHIGVPKLGTTAMRNRLFYPLKKSLQIDFLGCSSSPEYYGPFSNRVKFNDCISSNQSVYITAIAKERWCNLT